jgi:SAM-dependent methyltransferase
MVLEGLLLLAIVSVITFAPITPLVATGLSLLALCVILSGVRLIMQMAPPFVPTTMRHVQKMIAFADIRKGEHVYDLGCGDGRLLIAAAQKGALATGYEWSLPTLLLAKIRTRKYPTITVRRADFWEQDYRDADVIFCYLLIDKMAIFEKEIWPMLKQGTRVVSHMFPMPAVKPAKREGAVILYVKH